MRIIKLSKAIENMGTLKAVHKYFRTTLPSPEENDGRFYFGKNGIAADGLTVGEHLVFTYEKKVIYVARAKSGVRDTTDDPDRHFFLLDLESIRPASGDFNDLANRLYELGLFRKDGSKVMKNPVSQGWTREPIPSDKMQEVNAILDEFCLQNKATPKDLSKVKTKTSKGELLSLPRQEREQHEAELASAIRESSLLSDTALAARLKKARKIPEKIRVDSQVFLRNPDVITVVNRRANGICEECRHPAPFNKRLDGTPYLEVHHRTPLSQGGEDTVENAIALCPNCHRKAHHG